MYILGISGLYHDAAACLLHDGVIIAAAEEERFTRKKHDPGFPAHAIRYCLDSAGIQAAELDYVVFYEKPLRKLSRIVTGYLSVFPRSRTVFARAMQTWLDGKMWIRDRIRRELGYTGEVLFGEHHLSHAASAYYPSPFSEAAILTVDGIGEWDSTTLGVGHGIDLEITHEIRYPHSLGLLYSAFTAYLGFEVNEGEYKVMGLAAYGQPRHVDKVRQLIQTAEDGSFRLDLRYFAHHHSQRPISPAFTELFGPPRKPGTDVDDNHADIAASIQAVTEEVMLGLAQRAHAITGAPNLCVAGGVALNILANTRLLRESPFDEIWVQPAAGDSGGALGAAAHLYHAILRGPRHSQQHTTYLGPAYTDADITTYLQGIGAPHTTLDDRALAPAVANLIAEGNIIGWFQGRMEFGPRALGARSILADPRDPTMKDRVNAIIKQRESFRPFAPSVLAEAASAYFDFDAPRPVRESPFMLLAANVRPEKQHLLPAITHHDGTARVHTVASSDNPRYHNLIQEFGNITGVPIVLNTSLNGRGEPIAATPHDAYTTFTRTNLDYLVMGNTLIPAQKREPVGG